MNRRRHPDLFRSESFDDSRMPVERRRRAELDGRNRPLQLVPRKGRRISARAGRSELRLLVR